MYLYKGASFRVQQRTRAGSYMLQRARSVVLLMIRIGGSATEPSIVLLEACRQV